MDESNGVTVIDLPIEAVVYREDLYPRSTTHHEKVQEYAENLDRMPPIEVNQHHILIDGWHRWMAHKKESKSSIKALVTVTASEMELYDLAMERNNSHGVQVSREDKRQFATKRYAATPVRDRAKVKEHLLKKLSISESTLYNWIRRIDEDTSKTQRLRCFDLWLACYTQEEIAKQIGVDQATVARWSAKYMQFSNGEKMHKPAADHEVDFVIPQKNIWTEHDKTPHLDFPGSTEPRWVDNLLYFYTQPFDIVIDPFAGSGSTIEVCKKRFRRYWVSDRKPLHERAHEIRLWDMAEGLPPLHIHAWRDVKLVYLDPPYWKQREKRYSDDPTDLANMSLDDFNQTLWKLIEDFGKKIPSGAYIALIIQPTHWYAPEHAYIDHAMDMVKAVSLPLARRIACPIDGARYTEYLKWAMESREMLSLNREIIVWRVP